MTRTVLREIVDRIPDQEVENVAELILAYEAGDRARIAMLLAPEVEPEPDEIEALREADELDDGTRYTHEKVLRELGLNR